MTCIPRHPLQDHPHRTDPGQPVQGEAEGGQECKEPPNWPDRNVQNCGSAQKEPCYQMGLAIKTPWLFWDRFNLQT